MLNLLHQSILSNQGSEVVMLQSFWPLLFGTNATLARAIQCMGCATGGATGDIDPLSFVRGQEII